MILLCDVIYLIDIVSPNNEMYNKTSKMFNCLYIYCVWTDNDNFFFKSIEND